MAGVQHSTKVDEERIDFTFPNGSREIWIKGECYYISAPSPFGTTWGMAQDNGIHNGAYTAAGIWRRGQKWVPAPSAGGWVWEPANGR